MREMEALHSYPWGIGVSVPGLWSWRGAIFKKYMGQMPTPEEIGIKASHPFFDPEVICEGSRTSATNVTIDYHFHHHNRVIRRNEKRWKNYVLPRIAQLRAANEWPEGCTVNGQPL